MAGDSYCNNDMNVLAKTTQTAVAINTTEGEYIEKSVPRIIDWHHKACRVMTDCDPGERIFLFHPHNINGFFFLLTI